MTDEQQTDQSEAAAGQPPQQQFAIQRLYVKDMSFEAPMGVDAFALTWKPHVNQEINSKNRKVGDNQYEVSLSLTITVKLEDKIAFLVEVEQAGVFAVAGFDDAQLTQVLNTACLQILFPYARETLDSLAVKGSFPALMLPPINFDALYAQAVAQRQAQEQQSSDNSSIN